MYSVRAGLPVIDSRFRRLDGGEYTFAEGDPGEPLADDSTLARLGEAGADVSRTRVWN